MTYLIIWLVVGYISSAVALYLEYKTRRCITIKMLMGTIVLGLSGGLAFILTVMELIDIYGSIVIYKGKHND